MSYFRKFIIFFLLVIVISILAIVFIGNYFYNFALSTSYDKSGVLSAPQNKIEETTLEESHSVEGNIDDWVCLQECEEPCIVASLDGLKLHAYEISSEDSHLWCIACHGYNSNGKNMFSSTQNFYDRGFNLLFPDARGHGLSEGDYIGMGWDERKDICDWIEYILEKDPDAQIVLYGISMGAATVMMTSGETLPQNVKAIIEDCGYSSIWEEFKYQLKGIFKLPAFPVLHCATIMTKVHAGYNLLDGDALLQVSKSTTPILFIHGDEDTFVPCWMAEKVYDSAACDKKLLIIEGAGHATCSEVNPELYWSTVNQWLDTYIL